MAIKGLTDVTQTRRVGKIRAGFKDEKNRDMPKNTPYFLLHDAPGLSEVLGEKPGEIYFAAYAHDYQQIARDDLRQYRASELVCLGDGQQAAYFATGNAPYVRQASHPDYTRARARDCNYRNCPDFQQGLCSEHVSLDMVIPQHSMLSVYTLDNTSINAVLNIMSTLKHVSRMKLGYIGGEIFRLYKQDVELSYETGSGQRKKAPKPVVHLEHVPFEHYEKRFKAEIKSDDWLVLMCLRQEAAYARMGKMPQLYAELGYTLPPGQLAAPATTQALPPPDPTVADTPAPAPTQEYDHVGELANHPVVIALFEELAQLRGKANTEEARRESAVGMPDTQALIDRLKRVIASDKKKLAARAQADTRAQVQEHVEAAAPTAPVPTASPTEQAGASTEGGLV